MTTINTTTNNSDREISVDYNFGENVSESCEMFGETIVHNVFVANGVIKLQAFIRTMLNAEERVSDETIRSKVETWTLKAREKSDPVAKATKATNKLSDEQKVELMAKIQAELDAS